MPREARQSAGHALMTGTRIEKRRFEEPEEHTFGLEQICPAPGGSGLFLLLFFPLYLNYKSD